MTENVKNLRLQRFGRLIVNGQDKIRSKLSKCSQWECVCDCGKTVVVPRTRLLSGQTRSCGCLARERSTTHGLSKSREYKRWQAMKNRCRNANDTYYHRYGGRGIDVCERWMKFENFYEDMGPMPSSRHSVERLNNDAGYCPENCIWAEPDVQARNTSANITIEINGDTRCIGEWADRLGIGRSTVYGRLRRGATIEQALSKGPLDYGSMTGNSRKAARAMRHRSQPDAK